MSDSVKTIQGSDGAKYELTQKQFDLFTNWYNKKALAKRLKGLDYPVGQAIVDYMADPVIHPSRKTGVRRVETAQSRARTEGYFQRQAREKLKAIKESSVKFPSDRDSVKNYASWNLPPHAWSTPMGVADGGKYSKKAGRESLRRGRIYWIGNAASQKVTTFDEATKKFKESFLTESIPKRAYGFQFMWNPDSYSVQNALQTKYAPTQDDIFSQGFGMFPGASVLQFTVRLDRTNDFAALKSMTSTSLDEDYEFYRRYYLPNELPFNSSGSTDRASNGKISKLEWLRRYGTMADVEYLYRAVNDINTTKKTLTDGLVSADIGYMGFSLLAIDLGPMRYTGYITGISINHLLFTEDYIPIRSDLTISINVMASALAGSMSDKEVAESPTDSNPPTFADDYTRKNNDKVKTVANALEYMMWRNSINSTLAKDANYDWEKTNGWCLRTCRFAWGFDSSEVSAKVAWEKTPKKHKREKTTDFPPGALVYFSGDKNGYGHVTIASADPGYVWTTDYLGNGHVDKVSIAALTGDVPDAKWNLTYLGWTDWLNGKTLPLN